MARSANKNVLPEKMYTLLIEQNNFIRDNVKRYSSLFFVYELHYVCVSVCGREMVDG